MHYANCNTYNADYDGDEMNLHMVGVRDRVRVGVRVRVRVSTTARSTARA